MSGATATDRSTATIGATSFDVLHFSTVVPGRALPRLVRRIEDRGVQVVYDLEDTHWIPSDPALTTNLKARARLDLAELLDSPSATGRSFGIRVNAFGTEDAERDIALLASLAPRHRPHVVVLPKVDNAGSILRFLRACEAAGVAYSEVVPLIETTQAVDHLDDILTELTAAKPRSRVGRVMYGAYDHCLDSGRWPFWRQDEPGFWEIVRGLARTIEAHGFGYIHTPFTGLRATTDFAGGIQRLSAICRSKFTITTLDRAQVTAALSAREIAPPMPYPPGGATFSDADALALAYRVVKLFEDRKRRQHGFVVDSRDGRFFSPHEYVAATQHIARMTGARA